MSNNRLAVVWGIWGPYHYARYKALCDAYGSENCVGIALAGKSINYLWDKHFDPQDSVQVITLNPGREEENLSFIKLFFQFIRVLIDKNISIVFIPSYWPKTSFAVLMASKIFRKKCVMMNESHADTEIAQGIKRWIKKKLVSLFDAGLVGGAPHYKHFVSLGMRADKLYQGYDVVDNNYFENQSVFVRSNADRFRTQYGLPRKYILNLGRMVEKKNLTTLILAYSMLMKDCIESVGSKNLPALVLIGSGIEESKLISFAKDCGLKVRFLEYNRTLIENDGDVYFGGFRQINENPSFYTLSEVFILSSLKEEWGLVVNEAMACGVPVITSQNAGCATDLVIDYVNGFKFDPSNPTQLMNFLKLIVADEDLRDRMGKASKDIIKNWSCQFFAENAVRAAKAVYN